MLQVTTINSAFVGGGSSSVGTAVTIYALPPAHMPRARLIKANAVIQGTVASAASDNITVQALNASSAYSTTVATGAVTNTATTQNIAFTVTKASAGASLSIFTQARPAKITLPAVGNVTPPVQIELTWDGTAPMDLSGGV